MDKWTGRRFGHLVIKAVTEGRTADGHKIVLCSCDCGRTTLKGVDSLRKNATTQSCGCQRMSKGELLTRQALEEGAYTYKEEYSFSDLIGKAKHKLRFDFAIFNKANKLIALLEFDGRQHYGDVTIYPNAARTRETDELKNRYCSKHNIKLIRIPYTQEALINREYIKRLIEE